MTLDDILVEIQKAQKICLMAHEGPDGDAIGSCLGMYQILKEMGKDATVYMKKIPEVFTFLPGFDDIKTEVDDEKYDMAIVLDCPDIKRVHSDFIKYFENADVTVEFDHHLNNSRFADYNVVDHTSPACCQILTVSCDYLELEISNNTMTCFLTGIITDTGGFRHSGISSETFEIAGRALEAGINLSSIYKQALMTITKTRFEAQKLAMDRMEFFADNRICYTYLTKEDEKNLNLKDGEHEGIVNIGQNIKGVEVSIFLHEEDKGFKISLRANEYVNVSEVCMVFGGGGHIRAAGANSTMSLEDTKNAVIREIEKRLK